MNSSIVASSPAARKGIVLAGGMGTRMYPATSSLNKHLLPIYDKPMIYYPLATLMLAGIRQIMVVTTEQAAPLFHDLLADGSQWGLEIEIGVQRDAKGLVDALLVAETYAKGSATMVVLGDNLFYGRGFSSTLRAASAQIRGATIFAYPVGDACRFGVVELDRDGIPLSLEEKPECPASDLAITGMYLYDETVFSRAAKVQQSARGETEITDLNRQYLHDSQLRVEVLGRGFTWLDAGTHASLLDASNYVASIEKRQGLKIACLEEIAWRRGFITLEQIRSLALRMPPDYRHYLETVVETSGR